MKWMFVDVVFSGLVTSGFQKIGFKGKRLKRTKSILIGAASVLSSRARPAKSGCLLEFRDMRKVRVRRHGLGNFRGNEVSCLRQDFSHP
jgi:hypothetical protein